MALSSGICRRLVFGISTENDCNGSVPGTNSDNSIPQSKERKRKLCDVLQSDASNSTKRQITAETMQNDL